FHGYLPIEAADRLRALKQLEGRIYTEHQTQLFIETPYRNNRLLDELVHTCRPQTRLCIAANLTCADEFVRTRTIREWNGQLPNLSKVPAIFLLYK
ncbi:MAG: SAM-dependent methyltransferase, partial [Prevotellaceae bacterium]|nr:SAM-dependent methyltransferase [Prevotellaceae bacterium]